MQQSCLHISWVKHISKHLEFCVRTLIVQGSQRPTHTARAARTLSFFCFTWKWKEPFFLQKNQHIKKIEVFFCVGCEASWAPPGDGFLYKGANPNMKRKAHTQVQKVECAIQKLRIWSPCKKRKQGYMLKFHRAFWKCHMTVCVHWCDSPLSIKLQRV